MKTFLDFKIIRKNAQRLFLHFSTIWVFVTLHCSFLYHSQNLFKGWEESWNSRLLAESWRSSSSKQMEPELPSEGSPPGKKPAWFHWWNYCMLMKLKMSNLQNIQGKAQETGVNISPGTDNHWAGALMRVTNFLVTVKGKVALNPDSCLYFFYM